MHDDGLETIVAGVRCGVVLADLSDFVDGELLLIRVAQLRAHLAASDRCSQLGGDVSNVLDILRDGLSVPEPQAVDVASRLHARVATAMRS
jgi:anti-sigma factor RsiW